MKLMSNAMKSYVLRGIKNLGYQKAQEVAKATKSSVLIWMDPTRIKERQSAWAKYQARIKG
jgi:hypothetical protein